MKGISVIICCYNSGGKLIPTLHHLAKQQSMTGIPYELIIIDNNCTDNTIEIVTTNWKTQEEIFPLTIVQQPKPGLSYAREKGIETARYDYIVLCDDDNWLCDDYLLKVFQLMEAKPETALVGGIGEVVADIPIPGWFKALNGFGYAVGDEGRKTGYVDSLYGAGMGIRKPVFDQLKNGGFTFILPDRMGKNLSSGGDIELCLLVKKAGYKIYFDSSLLFKHFLSSDRLQWPYYLQLRKSFGKATAYLHLYDAVNSGNQLISKRNRARQFFLFIKYSFINFRYSLFPSLFQNVACANFVQQRSMQLTCLLENKKITAAARHMAIQVKQKQSLQYVNPV